jgi:ubiquinone/menaquinone biosynthesis C-methylase UbiE
MKLDEGARVSRAAKDWDRYVAEADALAQTPAFQTLRDAILDRAAPAAGTRAIDVGAGTGLLTLPLAQRAKKVWALDISEAMTEALRTRAEAENLENVEAVVGSATQLPLEDGAVDLVVSNYCLHHLATADKREALSECFRVLEPGGRLVFGDMMFELALGEARDRAIIASKIRALARKGPGGWLRLARHAARTVAGASEHPASPDWWQRELVETGFVEVGVEPLVREAGIAVARRPT